MDAYKLILKWQDGRDEVIAQGNNPVVVRAAHERIARNAKVVKRIELHDLTGPLETIWAHDWGLCARCRGQLNEPADLLLRLDEHRAMWRGRDVGLTHNEFKVVSLLTGTPGKYHTYRAIYDMLRGVGFHAGFRAAVRGYIKRIRAKFRAVDPDFACIITHSSVGYCWQSLK